MRALRAFLAAFEMVALPFLKVAVFLAPAVLILGFLWVRDACGCTPMETSYTTAMRIDLTRVAFVQKAHREAQGYFLSEIPPEDMRWSYRVRLVTMRAYADSVFVEVAYDEQATTDRCRMAIIAERDPRIDCDWHR